MSQVFSVRNNRSDRAYSRVYRHKKGKKGQNTWKLGQKCTKLENILKKGRWLHGIIAHNKLLEQALPELTPLAKTFCRSAVDRHDLKTY